MKTVILLMILYSTTYAQMKKHTELYCVKTYKLNDLEIEFINPTMYYCDFEGDGENGAYWAACFEDFGLKRTGKNLIVNGKSYTNIASGSKITPLPDGIMVNGKPVRKGVSLKVEDIKTPEVFDINGMRLLFFQPADGYVQVNIDENNVLIGRGMLAVKIWRGRLYIRGIDYGKIRKGEIYHIKSNAVLKKDKTRWIGVKPHLMNNSTKPSP